MDIKISTSYLNVDDPDAALVFYRDVLGYDVRNDVGQGEMRWITVGPASQPDVSVVLGPAAPEAPPAERKLLADMMAKGMIGLMQFTTDDLDATFEKLQASGADVVQEPIDQPWGVRDCAVRDPAGNMLRFNQA
ncbi:VOC family protein [Aeromicrobium sp.]|uniref:VOC family protein n=1 Tax=Aeromicrobium sp. TaxID=1871063 RepID=UPI002FC8DFD3